MIINPITRQQKKYRGHTNLDGVCTPVLHLTRDPRLSRVEALRAAGHDIPLGISPEDLANWR